jgi:glycosyltransferase involved in cell wall biosynthesis
MHLEGHVELLGLVDNPIDYYRRFTLFLLTSPEDSFPLAALENVAIGNPVIFFESAVGCETILQVHKLCSAPFGNELRFARNVSEILLSTEIQNEIRTRQGAKLNMLHNTSSDVQEIANLITLESSSI